jgi:hypothetical protein
MLASSALSAAFAAALVFQQAKSSPPASSAVPPAGDSRVPASTNPRKDALLQKIAEQLDQSTAGYLGGGWIASGEAKLAEAEKTGNVAEIFRARLALADYRLNSGKVEAAIDDYRACIKMTTTTGDRKAWQVAARKLGIAWMRFAELQNCVTHHNVDSCILPLRGGAIHTDRRGSEQASKVFEALLDFDPGDLTSLWLLNIAQMTLGSWPDGVPLRWRIPPSAFASDREMPRWVDIAPKVGLDVFGRSGGSILDDFDGDGVLEVVCSCVSPHQPLHFFKRQPDGTYKDIAAEKGLSGQLGGLQILQFDANNDGRLDLAVQRGAWLGDDGRIPNSLLIQQPDGTFVDRTLEAGVEVAMPSQSVAVADVDLDGDLDLFLGHEHNGGTGPTAYPCNLFRNNGDGTFTDMTEQAGVANLRYCKGAEFGDYDGDGLPDLYVSNQHDANRLYHNDGNFKFTDVAVELGVADPLDSFACWFFDYDNDGWLDIYATCFDQHDRCEQLCAWYKNRSTGFDTQRLYHNDGHGHFQDVTHAVGLDRTVYPMGSGFGDVDNDGYQDFYLATGDPQFTSLWPNILYHNDGGRRFEDVTTALGVGHLQKGHGVSFGDVDGDGDQDLFVQLGGAFPDDCARSVLFENPGNGNHWITVRLIGRDSNRFGVGSRIKVTIEENGKTRDVYHFVGAVSSFGGNSLQAEMGLGAASRIVAMEVFWPRTKKTQKFTDVPLDRIVVVDEGSDSATLAARAASGG